MKKKYIVPEAEVVNIHLMGSVLDNGELAGDSEFANTWDAKEQQFEWEEEAASNRPRNINLWEE